MTEATYELGGIFKAINQEVEESASEAEDLAELFSFKPEIVQREEEIVRFNN